jgi:tetratricopeptide (TPR) repeat protein
MQLRSTMLAIVFAACLQTAAVAGSENDLGKVTFPNSCSETAQPQLQRAVALLHSFWWDQSEAAFRDVLRSDPFCTIATWGIATVRIGNPFGAGPAAADAKVALALAAQMPPKTEREREYVKAVASYYELYPGKPHKARMRALADAFEEIAVKYRDDDETQIFFGLYLANTQSPFEKTLERANRAIVILNEQFAKHPDHPGVAHYLIHANDFPSIAASGLVAANCYAAIAPAAPHALHMPSHIFTRVGLWQQSAETNRKSRDAAKLAGHITDQLHAYDYWEYADLQLAHDDEAREIVMLSQSLTEANRAADYARAAIPARFAVERSQWQEAAQLPDPDQSEFPYTSAIRFFARALGAARSGDVRAAERDLVRLKEAETAMASVRDDYWIAEIQVQELAAQAWIDQARGARGRALQSMREAADKEDLSEKSSVSPGRLVPARELLGDMLFEQGNAAEALIAYEQSQKRDPKRFRTLWGAANAAAALGATERAKAFYTQIVEMTGSGDLRAEVALTRAWLAQHLMAAGAGSLDRSKQGQLFVCLFRVWRRFGCGSVRTVIARSRRRRDQVRRIVRCAIDRSRDWIAFEQRVGSGHEQRRRGRRIDRGAVEPKIEGVRRHDHRHAVVDGGKRAVRARGDEWLPCRPLRRSARSRSPTLPQKRSGRPPSAGRKTAAAGACRSIRRSRRPGPGSAGGAWRCGRPACR